MGWYNVLLTARGIGIKRNRTVAFTSTQLAHALGIESTDERNSSSIASAWLCKFRRWGYVVLAGEAQSTGGRPPKMYILTSWGVRCQPSTKKKASGKRAKRPHGSKKR